MISSTRRSLFRDRGDDGGGSPFSLYILSFFDIVPARDGSALKRRHTSWIFAVERSRSSYGPLIPVGEARGAELFSRKLFQSSRHNGRAARISPFAISLRLMVDTHCGTRERRPRIAGCIPPSVVLTNVRPKIRLTGPAFTSPPLQRSLAPFLVSRSSRPHSISTPTSAAPDPLRAEQSPNPFAS